MIHVQSQTSCLSIEPVSARWRRALIHCAKEGIIYLLSSILWGTIDRDTLTLQAYGDIACEKEYLSIRNKSVIHCYANSINPFHCSLSSLHHPGSNTINQQQPIQYPQWQRQLSHLHRVHLQHPYIQPFMEQWFSNVFMFSSPNECVFGCGLLSDQKPPYKVQVNVQVSFQMTYF